jgi:hypothetical protein
MKKAKLRLEDLRVDSFATGARDDRGTVFGQMVTEPCTYTDFHGYGYTCECANDSDHTWASCGTTCQPPNETCYVCGSMSDCGTVCVTGCNPCG